MDDIPAGFCLVGNGKYVPKGIDFYVYETYLRSPYRGKSISFKAMLEILDRHRGKWMLYTHATDNNYCARGFWCKTLGVYTGAKYSVHEQNIDNVPKLVFKYKN